MYIPRANEETRLPILHELIRAQPFAALVTMGSSGLVASHIPFVLHADGDNLGTLRGHISRANLQWSSLDPTVDALAIFSGPQHYITPTWYPAKLEHGKVVPTWNYVVVHAYGPLQVIHQADWLLDHLNQLTDQSEAATPPPWKVADAPADFTRQLLNGIVGFELPIRRLEGKWKLSQNRSAEDKAGVAAGLAQLDTPASLAMGELVAERAR